MKKLDLNYVVHFHDLTGKPDEVYETEANTCLELIEELDQHYPGFRDLLVMEDGRPRVQNAMILYHKGVRAHPVGDFSCPVGDGDYITFL